jgi:hypothetical protein
LQQSGSKSGKFVESSRKATFSFGQFQNSAFVNNQVLPLTAGDLGLNLQWQPHPDFYAILGVGPNSTPAGSPPWNRLSSDDIFDLLETAFVPTIWADSGPAPIGCSPLRRR